MDANRNQYEYASVYILDNPYCIDNTYDYFIPAEMRGDLVRGSFVTVPFGKGNRKQTAVVAGFCAAPKYKNIKSVFSVCDDKEPVGEEILELCVYLKEQVLCTMGDAIRSALPVSVLGKAMEYYYPTPGKSAPTPSAEFSAADLFVYEYIVSRGSVGSDALKAKFGAGAAASAVQKLLSKNYIGKEIKQLGGVGESYESYYTLVDRDAARKILLGDGEIKLRSSKHKEIIEYMLECEGEIPADKLKIETDCAQPQIKALIDKGIIEKIQKRIYRDSLSPEACEKKELVLSAEQSAAFKKISQAIGSNTPSGILLHGVTGSGKTGVIIKSIEEALALGKGVIVLLPEIALTPQAMGKFYSYFGDTIALVHSGLSSGERFDAYSRIISGEARVVIGTRSAVFSPVRNLGLIVIDEEHEATYKSETSPKYHARDIARWRCAKGGGVMLLASATPSLESYTKAREGKYTLLELKERYGGASLPEVIVHDMRNEAQSGNASPIGSLLREKLVEVTSRGEQAVLFLNRRGYNTMISCRSCGEVVKCPNCSVAMHYHTKGNNYDDGFLLCHLCGAKTHLPKYCPSCNSEHLHKMGFGTQRIQQELEELLPGKRIIRLDADTTGKKTSHKELLEAFRRHEGDVLLGTQMVTKGHDFPDVTLVGVLLADMSLYMDDYHANERTFSMLTQVIGRAGRGERSGMAIIQTNNPNNETINRACGQNYTEFYENEIRLRKLLVFPPYCDIALLTLTSSDEKQALMVSTRLREEIETLMRGEYADTPLIVFGPFEAPVYKVEGKYRVRMVVKCKLNRRSRELFSQLLRTFGKEGASRPILSVDFNPTAL